jgi:hypothetical protein
MRRGAIVAALILAAAASAAIFSAAQAQTCEDYWTAEYKCMQGCGPCGGGSTTGPRPTNDGALRLSNLTGRFNAILGELQQYDIPDVGDLYGAPAPTSLGELRARIDRLYVEAAFEKSRRYWQFEDNGRTIREAPALISTLRAENLASQVSLATAPQRLKEAEARRDAATAKADKAQDLASVFRSNTLSLEYDFVYARARAVWPIFELLPPDRKSDFKDAMTRGEKLPAYAILRPEDPPAVARAIEPPMPNAQVFGGDRPRLKPQPIDGSIEDKLIAFGDIKTVLGYVTPMMASQELRLPVLKQELTDLRLQRTSVADQLSAFESPLEKAKGAAAAAERRFLAAQVDQKLSAGNALRLASAAVVWNHIIDTLVVPQIEAILDENGLLKGLKGIDMLDRIQRSPQDFIPKVGPLKELPRLIETGKKVLSVEENMESFALAAAAANAQAHTAESERLAAHLFARLSQEGTDIMRTASQAMEGPQGKIAQALMERAPKDE